MKRGAGREALLRAVVRIVATQGIDAVTLRSVATEANVTYGLVHYHFGTRQAMIDEALRLAAQEHEGGAKILSNTMRLDDYGRGIPQLIAERPEGAAFHLIMVLEGRRSQAINATLRETYNAYVGAVADSLRAVGVEGDESLSDLVAATLDGVVKQQLIHGDPKRAADAFARLRQLLALLAESGGDDPAEGGSEAPYLTQRA